MKKINKILKILKENTDTVIIYNDTENNNFILEKNNSNNKIISVNFIKTHKILKNKINKNIDEKYRKEIINFINVLERKLPHCNFDLLNKNLETLKIKKIGEKKYTLAAYNSFYNKVLINKKFYKKTLTHELLHLASSKKNNNHHTRCGFDFHNIGFDNLNLVGDFINEGYTELLNTRYFLNTECYETNKVFASVIEKIIGKELMEKMYFNADIVGFINELTKYNNTKEEVIKFIINTDIIHTYIYERNLYSKIKIKKALIEVNDFLIKSYNEKIRKNLKNEENIKECMKLFVYALSLIRIGSNFNDKYIRNIEEYINYEHRKIKAKK